MARRRILATAAAAVLAGAYWATAGAGTAPTRVSTPRATAAAFLVAEIEAKADGRWRAAWSTLYPLHRRVAPRETFVRCERATPLPAQLESVRVVRTAPA